MRGSSVQAIFSRRRHQPMTGHFGRLVTRSSLVTTVTALLAITVSSRKNPNSATLSGSEIKKLNFGGKQKYAAAKALANEVRTPTVLPTTEVRRIAEKATRTGETGCNIRDSFRKANARLAGTGATSRPQGVRSMSPGPDFRGADRERCRYKNR